jgi:hypothetical protein
VIEVTRSSEFRFEIYGLDHKDMFVPIRSQSQDLDLQRHMSLTFCCVQLL